MDSTKMLSGSDLVARGVTKTNATLPDSGQKDISSSGSWLESKQIQSALDARRQLLEVERIEKLGSLSVAIWRDDIRMAEVTKKAGGHWQYIGHNVGKHLFLRPEEALYLIEINSLYLKHNEVVVSLQKAYTLCLGEMNLAQYKVYASLSRIGYRVFKHKDSLLTPIKDEDKKLLENQENFQNCNSDSIAQNKTSNLTLVKGIKNEQNVNRTSHTELNVQSTTNQEMNDGTPLVMDYSPINSSNIESTSIVEDIDVDMQEIRNKSDEDFSTASEKKDVDANTEPTYLAVDRCQKENQQNTVIVTAKTKDKIVTEEINNVQCNENKDSGGTTVIVSIKSNIHIGNVPRDNNTGSNADDGIVNCKITPDFNAERPVVIYSVDEIGVIRMLERDNEMNNNDDVAGTENIKEDGEPTYTMPSNNIIDNLELFMVDKVHQLLHRRAKPTQNANADSVNLSDCFDRKLISVHSPHVKYLPRNIFLMKTHYFIDMVAIKRLNSKSRKNSNTESLDNDCSNANEARHLSVAGNSVNRSNNFAGQQRFQHNSNANPMYQIYPPYHSRPIWNSRQMAQSHYSHYNRPRYPIYRPNLNLFIRSQNFNTRLNVNQNNQRKRGNTRYKSYHLSVITNLAQRFRVFAPYQIQELRRLVNTFNELYDEGFEMTDDFKLVHTNDVQEVIVLDDDGEPKPKKARPNDDSDKINKHLDKLKALAAKLKDLETKHSISRHRRVLTKAIKTFNKYFDADIYLNSNFEIIDSKLITLDSSSDSDSVVAVEENSPKSKKLRNPFSVLKNSWKINEGASTSREVPILKQLSLNVINEFANTRTEATTGAPSLDNENTGEGLLKYFHKAWLPDEDDFGRAEVCSKQKAYLFDLTEAEYLYAYFKYRSREFENWLELKIALLERVQERLKAWKERALSNGVFMGADCGIQPLVGPECTDTISVLKKLQIIPSSMQLSPNANQNIEVDFDVYYGNSPSFKKANRPKPSFRVLCIDVSEDILSGQHINALCSKYSKDDVPLVVAAVGVGSISYLQISSSDIPVYLPDNLF